MNRRWSALAAAPAVLLLVQSTASAASVVEPPPSTYVGTAAIESHGTVNTASDGDLWLDFNDVPAATIVKSTDHGRTWTWDKSAPMFGDHVFTTIWFADYGKGNSRSPDGYVYAYGLDGNWRDSFDDTVKDPQDVYL